MKPEWWICSECGENFLSGSPIDMIDIVRAYRRGRVKGLDEADELIAGEMIWDDNAWPPHILERIAVRYVCSNCGAELDEDYVIEVMKEREREDGENSNNV